MSGAASGARRRVLPLAVALLLGAMSPVGAQEVGRVFRDCGNCPEMLVVPSGSYTMGSPASEAGRFDDEGPLHRVTIGYTLAVGVYEVTFAEWDGCVDAGGCAGVPARGRGLGPREPAGDQCELGGCAGIRPVVVAGDGRALPAVERVGVGVCGTCGDGDGAVLGGERVGAVPVREWTRCCRVEG